MSLVSELKRRGVFQVGVAYTVVAWLLVQVSDIILPTFDAPGWVMKVLILLFAAGFPISLFLAWFYNITPDGLRSVHAPAADNEHEAFPGQLLNYIIIGVLTSAVLLFAVDKFVWKTELPFDSGFGPVSVAVLPFRNLSGDEANEPFVNGIHDDLLTQLSRISSLRVISRTSVMKFGAEQISVPLIAEELGVAAVVEGGVQRSGDRIRVNAQLIDGTSDIHLWAQTYDRRLTAENVFSIQSEISRSIAKTLSAELSDDEEKALDVIPTRDLRAYEAYVSGRASVNSPSNEDYEHALEQFTLAVELDPEFAAAWAGLCLTHLGRYQRDSDPESFAAAERSCERALELDDSRVEVYVALGTLYRYFGQYSKAEVALQSANYARAEAALEHALDLDDVELDALVELGHVLARQGRLEEAEQSLLKAEDLEPQSWHVQTGLFSFYYSYSDRPDRFERAARHAARGASLKPELTASWNNLGAANYMLGRFELAADAWEESLKIEPNRTGFTNTGVALFYSGQYEEAAKMQEQAISLAPNDHRATGRLGDALRYMEGQEQRAMEAYRKASAQARELLKVNDREWRTLGQLAVYQAQLGEDGEARSLVERALQFSERNAETLYNLALVDTIAGRNEAAVEVLREAIGKDPEYRNLLVYEPDFRTLRETPGYQEVVAGQ